MFEHISYQFKYLPSKIPRLHMEIFADLEQYKIVKRIHTSNFSRTMLVSNKNSGELKIMKTIFYTLNDESSQNHFLNNFYELKSIIFPTLLPYRTFSFDISSSFHPSIILDYYKNGSLYNCCKKLNNTQKVIVLVGIVEGMRYLHFNGHYHGCLEPGNIILDDNFHPLICSYGLSELSEDVDFDVFRSPFTFPSIVTYSQCNYSSSKKEEEELKMKQADDVFAFSMLLYFILTNETPLQKRCTTCQQRIEMFIRNFRPTLPPWVPRDLANLEHECWNPDGEKRPTFKEISNRLQTCTAILPPGIDVGQVSAYLKSIGDPEKKTLHTSESINQSQNNGQNQKKIPTSDQNQNLSNFSKQSQNQIPKSNINLNSSKSQIQSPSMNRTPIRISNMNQNISKSQGQSPNISQSQSLKQSQNPIQKSNSTEISNQETNVKKRRIFLKFQKPEDIPKQPEAPPLAESQPKGEISKNSDSTQFSAPPSSVSTFNIEPNLNENPINGKNSALNQDDLNYYYDIFSDKSEQTDNSESSEFLMNDESTSSKSNSRNIRNTSKSQPVSAPKPKPKLKSESNSDSNSDSVLDVSSDLGSDSESDQGESKKFEEISPELHEQLKQQTEEGKREVLSGQIERGVQLIKQAADSFYRGAILAYGNLLECGVGVRQDLKQAAAYYGKAVSMGSNNAKAAYSRFAMKGLGGVEHNSQAAINLLSKAATDQLQKWQKKPNLTFHSDMKVNKKKKGSDDDSYFYNISNFQKTNIFPCKTEAMYQYGKVLKKKAKNEQDWGKYEQALKFVQPAAEKDHNIRAMNLYGEILLELGKQKQYPKMAKYFKIAADEGNSKAQYHYGNCRKEGLGVTENYEEAVRYFKMSADQKNPNGLNEYGIALQEGFGIQQDVIEAKKYIKMAADLGNADAQYNYVIMLQLKIGINADDQFENQEAEREILEYLKKASDSDLPDAMVLYSTKIIQDLDGLSEEEKTDRLKTAKFYLKRISKVCHDEGICEEAQTLLAQVKDMMNK